MNNELEIYYNKALQFTRSHYEYFPVLSFFIKKDLQEHVAVVYQFARQADDIADEGNNSEEKRIADLNNYELQLLNCVDNNTPKGFWKALNNTISKKKLNPLNFFNLLKAFKSDITKNRFGDYNEVLQYCENSANPVGRIILELHEIRNESALSYSDKICTALQLTNFYQDVGVDIEKGRIYIPKSEMDIFNVLESEIEQKLYTEKFINLMKFQIERTRKLFREGRNLLKLLPTRLKFQILITIKGGEEILNKIEHLNYNVLEKRPTLSKMEFIKLFISSIIFWK